ncbi:EscJ/YscJ/HrcJ family type III secretion inner membrane ring protein [Methylobacterium sp. NI91]|nr:MULTISPECIES: type III secretion inner membrane ring lipoprotein SctJ [unclassified Methylobacterium]QIJ76042.1 EscJ/YscJ/HrcJ family type III secretion inner membrane ring protein [Methylobacterium sp. CLZ]QIJ80944.1 EscJ/YscJ/HrcJ family type III secretion inner membrane ring protein [Methylobacterium sp. NI91]
MPSARPNAPTPRLRRLRPVAMLAVLALLLGACKTDLYTKLSEREANEMVALLLDKGISASRVGAKDGTSSIQVEDGRFAQAVEVLKAGGYPRQSFTNMGEVFKGGGLIASPTEERARYVYALSEELSKTISSIDGVLSARIHVVLPKNDLLKQDATPSSASVFIRHDQEAPLKTLLPQIKMLVANSIEGLSYEKVSVVFVPVDRSQNASAALAAPAQAAATGDGLDPVATGIGGAGGALALAGAGYWWLRRRRRMPARREAELGALETLEPADPALAPPESRPAVALKRVA